MNFSDLEFFRLKKPYNKRTWDEIRLIKEKIINFLFLTFMVFLLPALFSLLLRSTSLGLKPLNYMHIGLSVILIIVFVFRNRLPYLLKLIYLLFLIYALSTGGLFTFGIYSYGLFFMLLWVIFSFVLVDSAWGIVFFLFSILTFVIAAYLFTKGYIDFDHNVITFNNTAMGWFMGIIIFSLVSLMIVLLTNRLFAFLVEQVDKSKTHEEQLEQINRLLTREIETRKKAENLLKKQVKDSNQLNQEYLKLNSELQTTNLKLEQSNELLKEAKEKAQMADMLKTSFLSNMSHEIRTPLNAIVGFSTLLSTGEYTPDEQKRYIGVIHSSSNYLLNIISDIVNMAKIEARQFTLYPEIIELNGFIDEISERYTREVFIQKEGDVNFEINKAIPYPCHIISDIECLRQVTSKLLDNAIKFTENGYIRLTCSLNNNGLLTFEISDTGIGIDKNIHQEVFDLFRQIDANSTRRFGGTGLGLSITKGLIDLLNGQIDFFANEGHGTIFTVKIPVVIKPSDNEPNIQNSSKVKVKTIMVVGKQTWDNVDINHILQKTNSLLIYTETGFQAIELISKNEPPDIFIVASALPDNKPSVIAKQIHDKEKNIPVICHQLAHSHLNEILEETRWSFIIEPDANLIEFEFKLKQLLS